MKAIDDCVSGAEFAARLRTGWKVQVEESFSESSVIIFRSYNPCPIKGLNFKDCLNIFSDLKLKFCSLKKQQQKTKLKTHLVIRLGSLNLHKNRNKNQPEKLSRAQTKQSTDH